MSGRRRIAGGERAASEKLLRAAAADRVEATSLRGVAREIGISPPGLSYFLEGTSPHTRTLEKIRAWHHRQVGPNGTSAVTACTALFQLVAHLPHDERGAAIRMILTIVAALHRNRGTQGPPWLAALREEFGAGDE